MKKLYFCNASKRVPCCKRDTNLCCLVCTDLEECTLYCKKNNIKVKPCHPEDFEEDEKCNFKV